ncbi:hypothetical protein D3C75_793570 [compost metagenome]
MPSFDFTGGDIYHVTGLCRQVLAEKFAEVALADEADAGAVFFLGSIQSGFLGDPAHFRLRQMSDREHGLGELVLVQRIQEIGLILVAVHAAQQLKDTILFNYPCVVSCCNIIRAKLERLVQEFPELDLAVAHNIRIRRPPGLIFIEEIGKDFIKVFLLEINGIVRNIDLLAYAAYILSIGLCRAYTELVGIVPVLHEDADDVIALLLEQKRCNGGIDSSRHADDDTCILICLCHRNHHFLCKKYRYHTKHPAHFVL